MAGGPNRIGPVGVHTPLSKNGIVRIGEIGATQFLRSQHDLGVIDAGAAFRRSQIIIAILAENMRAFDPHRLFADVDAAVDQLGARADHLTGAPVIFLNPDGAMPVIAGRFIGRAVVDDIGLVALPINGRVDPFKGQPDGVGPGTGRISGRDDEVVAASHAGIDDVEDTIMPANVRCEDGF